MKRRIDPEPASARSLRRIARDIARARRALATHQPCGHEFRLTDTPAGDCPITGADHRCDVDQAGHAWHICACKAGVKA